MKRDQLLKEEQFSSNEGSWIDGLKVIVFLKGLNFSCINLETLFLSSNIFLSIENSRKPRKKLI